MNSYKIAFKRVRLTDGGTKRKNKRKNKNKLIPPISPWNSKILRSRKTTPQPPYPLPLRGRGIIRGLEMMENRKRPGRPRKQKKPLPPYSLEFLSFYEAYPRKSCTQESAWKAWLQKEDSGTLPPFDELMAALEFLKKSRHWLQDDGKWIQGIKNFLLGEYWYMAENFW